MDTGITEKKKLVCVNPKAAVYTVILSLNLGNQHKKDVRISEINDLPFP